MRLTFIFICVILGNDVPRRWKKENGLSCKVCSHIVWQTKHISGDEWNDEATVSEIIDGTCNYPGFGSGISAYIVDKNLRNIQLIVDENLSYLGRNDRNFGQCDGRFNRDCLVALEKNESSVYGRILRNKPPEEKMQYLMGPEVVAHLTEMCNYIRNDIEDRLTEAIISGSDKAVDDLCHKMFGQNEMHCWPLTEYVWKDIYAAFNGEVYVDNKFDPNDAELKQQWEKGKLKLSRFPKSEL